MIFLHSASVGKKFHIFHSLLHMCQVKMTDPSYLLLIIAFSQTNLEALCPCWTIKNIWFCASYLEFLKPNNNLVKSDLFHIGCSYLVNNLKLTLIGDFQARDRKGQGHTIICGAECKLKWGVLCSKKHQRSFLICHSSFYLLRNIWLLQVQRYVSADS